MSVFSTRGPAGSRLLLSLLAAGAVSACSSKETPTPPPPPPPPPTTRSFSVTPATVSFSDTLGTAPPAAITVNIANTGDSAVGAISIGTVVYGAGGADWLTFALSGNELPATLSLQPDMTTLTAGSYTATVPVISARADSTPRNIQVTFTLAAQPPVPPDPPPSDPPPAPIPGITILASGNVARCNTDGSLGGFSSKSFGIVQRVNPDLLFVLGDIVYPPVGSNRENNLADFETCYGLTFGQYKAKTYAAVGGREVDSLGFAHGADAYFGAAVGNTNANYYAFTAGTWRIIVLAVRSGGNSLPARSRYGFGSAQLAWLENELNTNTGYQCTLVMYHDPMWMSSSNESSTDPNLGIRRQPQRGIWNLLYDKRVDVVLGGGDHIYERFAPMRYNRDEETTPDPSTWGPPYIADNTRGVVQFSTGLAGDGPLATPHVKTRHPLSIYRSGGNGLLRMTLGAGEYTWFFENGSGSNVQDWGRRACH